MYQAAASIALIALLATSCSFPDESRETCDELVRESRLVLVSESKVALQRAKNSDDVSAAIRGAAPWVLRSRSRFHACFGVEIADGADTGSIERSPLMKASQVVELLRVYADSSLPVDADNWKSVRRELTTGLEAFEQSP